MHGSSFRVSQVEEVAAPACALHICNSTVVVALTAASVADPRQCAQTRTDVQVLNPQVELRDGVQVWRKHIQCDDLIIFIHHLAKAAADE